MNQSSSSSHDPEKLPASSDAVAVENSQSQQPGTDKDEDKVLKCEQLVRNPPGIEEIRRTPQLGIESREIRVERTSDSYRWVVYRSRGSAPVGWHVQSSLDKLHFNPALQFLLPDKDPQYLAYAPSVAETPQDSEQAMSYMKRFGSVTVLKEPPCSTKPKLAPAALAQNPAVLPKSLMAVTWVCTDPGKFSL